MDVGEIIIELDNMTEQDVGTFDTLATHCKVEEAGNGSGNLEFTIQQTANSFDALNFDDFTTVIETVQTHELIISENPGWPPR